MDKIKELLTVLDLPEEGQWKKLRPFTDVAGDDYERGLYSKCLRKRVLADLAFRLRDEAVETCRYKYDDAIIQVYSVSKKSAEEFHWWWIRHSQPIHIIIAALIAKELAKKDEKTP